MNICQLKAMLLNAFSVETGRGGGATLSFCSNRSFGAISTEAGRQFIGHLGKVSKHTFFTVKFWS